jgi:serine/threonine-protein kinase
VIRTEPAAGTSRPKGSTITMVVSSGPQAKDVTVPLVTGLTEAQATQAIESRGLEVQVVDDPLDPDAPDSVAKDGRVLSQNPSSGAKAKTGDTVTIHVGFIPGD